MKELKFIKIKNISSSEKEETYDISVKEVEHYILKNGIISHNSTDLFPSEILKGGKSLIYTSSTIVMMSKAKLKTGDEDEMDLNQSGIVVTAKSAKNRLAKPKKIKFEIDFTRGCNPFKGLEAFCIPQYFEKVGVAMGKMEVDKSTGEMLFKPGGNRWYVRHLDKTVTTKQLHTPEVFTKEVLDALEPIIKDYFSYKSMDEMDQMNKEIEELETQFEQDMKKSGVALNELSDQDLFD